MKRLAALGLAAVLACTGFTACGEEREKRTEAKSDIK